MHFYDKVNSLCLERGISITAMAMDLGISKGTPSNWKVMDKPPRADTIKKVADYFDVPVDYFKEGVSVSVQSVQDNYGIIGHAHAPVTIINGSERKLTEQEVALIGIFEGLDVVKQAQLLSFAADLAK